MDWRNKVRPAKFTVWVTQGVIQGSMMEKTTTKEKKQGPLPGFEEVEQAHEDAQHHLGDARDVGDITLVACDKSTEYQTQTFSHRYSVADIQSHTQ